MHVEFFDQGDGADRPIAVVFVTPDFRIQMDADDYQRYEYFLPTETLPPSGGRKLTIEERIAEVSNRLRDPIDQPPARELPKREPDVRMIMTPEEEAITGGDELHPMVAETMSMIDGLDLQRADPLKAAGILINDEAGPDGSSLTDDQWAKLIELLMFPITEAEAQTTRGKSLITAKQNAWIRIRGLPLAVLVRHQGNTPRQLRMQIAMFQCSKLGVGPKGEGGDWIPNSYAAYVEGDDEWASKEEQAIYGHHVSVRDPRPPRVKEPALAAAMSREGFGKSDLMSLERQFNLSSSIVPQQ